MPRTALRGLLALSFLGVMTTLICPSVVCGCQSPPSIAHGSHKDISSFFSFTTVVQYSCDEGYVLVGQAKVSCKDSRWSSPGPQCKALCLKPEIEHGGLSEQKEQYVEPENVTVQCTPGYDVIGSQNITCSENRTWSPAVPRCEWAVHKGCEKVTAGRELLHCLSNPEDVKMALEVYKLSLEIRQLEDGQPWKKRAD